MRRVRRQFDFPDMDADANAERLLFSVIADSPRALQRARCPIEQREHSVACDVDLWSGVQAAGASGATWELWVDTPGRRGEESTFRHFA
jgi:hypothetical protein